MPVDRLDWMDARQAAIQSEDRSSMNYTPLDHPLARDVSQVYNLGEDYTYYKSGDPEISEPLKRTYDLHSSKYQYLPHLRRLFNTTKNISVEYTVEGGVTYYLISYLISVPETEGLLHRGMLKKRYNELKEMEVSENFWGADFWSGVMDKAVKLCPKSCKKGRAEKLKEHLLQKSNVELLKFFDLHVQGQRGGKRKRKKSKKSKKRTKNNRRKKSQVNRKTRGKTKNKRKTQINRRTKRRSRYSINHRKS